MTLIHRVATTIVGVLGFGAGLAATASAGCVDPVQLQKHPSLIGVPSSTASFSSARVVAASARASSGDNGASIVGMWHVTFHSLGNNVPPFNIPDGAPLDDGYAQWHSDGTEIMNSGRDPVTSSFCLGVWENQGGRTYKLNHFALSWDNTGTFCVPQQGATNCPVGRANIREQVTVDPHGDTYSGWVTIDQYDTSGKLMFTLKGRVTAERITVD